MKLNFGNLKTLKIPQEKTFFVQNLEKYSKFISGKKFLISGANGFLGKYFIKTLITINKSLSKKIKITAIDIKFDKCEIYFDKNVKKIKKDINKID